MDQKTAGNRTENLWTRWIRGVGPYGRSAPRERPGPEEERLGALPASGGSPPVVCWGGRGRRRSPCFEPAGAESGWLAVRGVDVGRQRGSPVVFGCEQPDGPSRSPLFPAVPRFGRAIGSRRRHRSWAISTSASTRPESCVETSSRPVVADLGTTRPAHRTLWIPLLVVSRSVPSPWWIESFPPAMRRTVRTGGSPAQVSCSLLCPRRSKICGK
jgi:hypothetical protein